MRGWYQRWMHDWETRLTNRDTNRVVRPLEWGLEWSRQWPCINGFGHAEGDAGAILTHATKRILAASDEFFSYRTPSDFRLEKTQDAADDKRPPAQFLRFTSPVQSPYPENNTANARWFPAKGRAAVVVLPQWNADAESHVGLSRIFQFLNIAALRLSKPYHDVRKPPEIERSDYAVSSNICRTIDAARQAICDVRSCLDWLQTQGYDQLGIVGTSLGSCYAFIASAHDPRIRVAAFNHASTYFADVVWRGQSTRHIRAGIENDIDLDRLRRSWLAISPMSYFDKYARYPRRSLVIYATYDLTFMPDLSLDIVNEFRRRHLDCEVSVLPCGHYTCGESPYKYLDAYYLASFLKRSFGKLEKSPAA